MNDRAKELADELREDGVFVDAADELDRLRVENAALKAYDLTAEMWARAGDEITSLRAEVALVRVENERVRSDIDRIRVEVEQRTADRDEARREVCECKWMEHSFDILKYAQMRGWNCFTKENSQS